MAAADPPAPRETAAELSDTDASKTYQAFLLTLSDALRPLTDAVAIQAEASRVLAEHLRVGRAYYGELDHVREMFVVEREYVRDDARRIVGDHPFAVFGPVLDALERGRTMVVGDTLTDARIADDDREAYSSRSLRSFIAVPLVKSGVTFAVMAATDADPRQWSEIDVTLVQETAERTWAAVDRARAEAALRESEKRQAFLLDFGDVVRARTNDVQVLHTAAELLGEYIDADRCFFGELLSPQGIAIMHPDYRRANLPSVAGRFSIADFRETVDALQSGRPMTISDVGRSNVLSSRTRATYTALGYASFLAVPLFKRGELVLTLSVVSSRPRDWTSADIQLTQEIAERTWTVVERARAEAALRESEARFRAVADLVPDLLWESEPNGAMPWFNARWLAYTGQSLDDARGWGWLDAIHPDDRAETLAAATQAIETTGIFVHEFRVRRYDNVYRWFLARAEPLRDEAGNVVRRFGAATDIHAQRSALEDVERLATERTAERDALRRQLVEAEEAERRRLARELHDQLGQELTAFRLGLDDALRLVDAHDANGRAPLRARLEQLHALAGRMTAGARAIALELRPPELDDVGLESALESYVHEWSARYGIAADVAVTGVSGRAVPTEVASALYRIAQEALTNVAKHASAKQVSVVVDKPDGEVRLIVEDDGLGFDVDTERMRARREQRLGLAGMQERAALVGGEVTVESSPGVGTTLFARLPAHQSS